MRNLLLSIFVLMGTAGLAQEYQYVPFPTANAQWHTDGYDGNCLPPGLCFQSEVGITGDTVVNGHTYTMVNGMDNGVPWEFSYAWFREDVEERKVYAMWRSWSTQSFDGAVEYVAYDFSLAIGDTFIAPPPLHVSVGQGDTTFYVITSIDSVLIGDVLRKRLWFNPNTLVSSNFWIEGIGGEPGPFISHYMFEGWHVLRCMWHEDELVYSNPLPGPPEHNLQMYPWYEYCGPYWVGITEPTKLGSPASLTVHGGQVTIPDLGAGPARYALYSLLGQQLMEGSHTGKALQIPYLPPGIYVLRLQTTERQFVFKIINP